MEYNVDQNLLSDKERDFERASHSHSSEKKSSAFYSNPKSNFFKYRYIPRDEEKTLPVKIIVFNVIIGQILAILSVGSRLVGSHLENEMNLVTPLCFTMVYYFLLFIFNIILTKKLKFPKIRYILITIFDSQAIFLNVLAFSVLKFDYPFIINMSTVFWTIIITWIFIKSYKYRLSHFFSTILAVLGIVVTFIGIYVGNISIANSYEGLLYCLGSSVCMSISSVLQEITFKSGQEIYDFLPNLGLYGFVITTIESFILGDIWEFTSYDQSVESIGFILLFGFLMVIFYQITPFYIMRVKASIYNISLLSQIFYSYIVSVIFYGRSIHGWSYYVGFGIILCSIIWFNLYPVHIVNNDSPQISDLENPELKSSKKKGQPFYINPHARYIKNKESGKTYL